MDEPQHAAIEQLELAHPVVVDAKAVEAEAVEAEAVEALPVEEQNNLSQECKAYLIENLLEILTALLLGKLINGETANKLYFINLIVQVKEIGCNIEDVTSITREKIVSKNKAELTNLTFGIIRKLTYTDFENVFTKDMLIKIGNLSNFALIRNNNTDKAFCQKLYTYFSSQYDTKHNSVVAFINANEIIKALLKDYMNPELGNDLKKKNTWIKLFTNSNMTELLSILDINISQLEKDNGNVSTKLLSNYYVLFLYFLTSIRENIIDSLKNYAMSSEYSIKESDKMEVFDYKTKLDARQNLAIQRFSSFSNKDDKCCFLFHGVGTGKTITSLSIALSYLKEENLKTADNLNPKPFKILIVAPTGLFYSSFKNDCAKLGIYTYAPELDEPPFEKFIGFTKGELANTEYLIEFIGYDYDSFFDKNREDYGFVKNLSELEFDALICDESHRLLKNNIDNMANKKFFLDTTNRKMKTETGIVRNTLSDQRFYSFIKNKIKIKSIFLTGTPFQESFYDMISIALFLNTNINSSNMNAICNDSESYGNFTGLFLPLSNPIYFIEKYGQLQSLTLSAMAGTFNLFKAFSDGIYKNRYALGASITTYLLHTYGSTIYSYIGPYGFELLTNYMPNIVEYIRFFNFSSDSLNTFLLYCIPTIIMLSSEKKDEFVEEMIKEVKERSSEFGEFQGLQDIEIRFTHETFSRFDGSVKTTDSEVVEKLLKPAFNSAMETVKKNETRLGGGNEDTIRVINQNSQSELISSPLVKAFLLNMTPKNFLQIAKTNTVESILLKIDPEDKISTAINMRDRTYSQLLTALILKSIKDECDIIANGNRFETVNGDLEEESEDNDLEEESEEFKGGAKGSFVLIIETILQVIIGTFTFAGRKGQSILDTIIGFTDISGGGLSKLINQVLQILKDTKKMGENVNVGAYIIEVTNFCVILVDNLMKDWFEINMDMIVKHTKPYASVYNYDYNRYAIDENKFNEDIINNIHHKLLFTNADGNKYNFPKRYVEHILVPFTLKQTQMFSLMGRLLDSKDKEQIKGLLSKIRNFQNNVACGIENAQTDLTSYENGLIQSYQSNNDAKFKNEKKEYESKKIFTGEKQIILGGPAVNIVNNLNISIVREFGRTLNTDDNFRPIPYKNFENLSTLQLIQEPFTGNIERAISNTSFIGGSNEKQLYTKIEQNLLAFFKPKIDSDAGDEIKNGTNADKIKYIGNIDILKSSDKMDSGDDKIITEEYRFENILYLLKIIRCGCVFQNKDYHPHPHYYYKNAKFEYYLPVIYPTTNDIMYSFCDFLNRNGENYIWMCNKMNKLDIKNNYEYGATFTYPITSEKIPGNPICIIISPDHTEGFSFTFNPAIFLPVLCDTAGDQEQVYGRVLRKYGNHGQKGMYEKMVYQYCGGGIDDINNINMIGFINKLDENDLYSDAVNRNIVSSATGITSFVSKDMIRNAALPIAIGLQSLSGIVFNQIPYEWQRAAAYWSARVSMYNQGYDENANRLKNAINETTRIWNLGHISESRNLQELTKIISLSKLYFDKFLESENMSYLIKQIMIEGKNTNVTLIKPIDLELINKNKPQSKTYCKTYINNILCINHIENPRIVIEPELNEYNQKRRELITEQILNPRELPLEQQPKRTWIGYLGEKLGLRGGRIYTSKKYMLKNPRKTVNKYRTLNKYRTISKRNAKRHYKTKKRNHKNKNFSKKRN